jgi:hypothetical protein
VAGDIIPRLCILNLDEQDVQDFLLAPGDPAQRFKCVFRPRMRPPLPYSRRYDPASWWKRILSLPH